MSEDCREWRVFQEHYPTAMVEAQYAYVNANGDLLFTECRPDVAPNGGVVQGFASGRWTRFWLVEEEVE